MVRLRRCGTMAHAICPGIPAARAPGRCRGGRCSTARRARHHGGCPAGSSDGEEGRALQAYRLYNLALAGQARAGAARILFEHLDSLPSPLAKAQLARRSRSPATTSHVPNRLLPRHSMRRACDWSFDYGSAVRDQAETAVLLKESGVLPDRLAALIGRLPAATPIRSCSAPRNWLGSRAPPGLWRAAMAASAGSPLAARRRTRHRS